MATTQAAPTDAEQEGNDQASHPTTADDSQSEAQEVSNTNIIGKISWCVIRISHISLKFCTFLDTFQHTSSNTSTPIYTILIPCTQM